MFKMILRHMTAVTAAIVAAMTIVVMLPAQSSASNLPAAISKVSARIEFNHTSLPSEQTLPRSLYHNFTVQQTQKTVFYRSPRLIAYWWAVKHAKGCWYSWGGTSCATGFDCSGMVMRSWEAAGVNLPRTTYDMLASPLLVPIAPDQARKGDLAFFGSGHVELVAYLDRWTIGARDWGTRVSFYRNLWFTPTAYYRIRTPSWTTMYDAGFGNAWKIPASARAVAGHSFTAALWSRWPHAAHITIAHSPLDFTADAVDFEPGGHWVWGILNLRTWLRGHQKLTGERGTVYVNAHRIWMVKLAAQGLRHPFIWACDQTGIPHMVPGAIATQWFGSRQPGWQGVDISSVKNWALRYLAT